MITQPIRTIVCFWANLLYLYIPWANPTPLLPLCADIICECFLEPLGLGRRRLQLALHHGAVGARLLQRRLRRRQRFPRGRQAGLQELFD